MSKQPLAFFATERATPSFQDASECMEVERYCRHKVEEDPRQLDGPELVDACE